MLLQSACGSVPNILLSSDLPSLFQECGRQEVLNSDAYPGVWMAGEPSFRDDSISQDEFYLNLFYYSKENPVSYTHLDVYKRQILGFTEGGEESPRLC